MKHLTHPLRTGPTFRHNGRHVDHQRRTRMSENRRALFTIRSIHAPGDTWDHVKARAAAEGIPLGRAIAKILREYAEGAPQAGQHTTEGPTTQD